jgi:hypothetical protein
MALPSTVRIKLSSEAAESIALTPVVVQELPLRELVEHILGLTGKDAARIGELLLRGTLVVGGSRFRWQGWEADPAGIHEVLATFPDADPSRPFAAPACLRAVLRGGLRAIELPREAASKKGMFQRDSFWDTLMRVASAEPVAYAGYSYRERADRYLRDLTFAHAEEIRAAADAVKFTTLRDQIRTVAFNKLELFAHRGPC